MTLQAFGIMLASIPKLRGGYGPTHFSQLIRELPQEGEKNLVLATAESLPQKTPKLTLAFTCLRENSGEALGQFQVLHPSCGARALLPLSVFVAALYHGWEAWLSASLPTSNLLCNCPCLSILCSTPSLQKGSWKRLIGNFGWTSATAVLFYCKRSYSKLCLKMNTFMQ